MNVAGQVETPLSFDEFAKVFAEGEWHAKVGRYAIELSGRLGHCKFVWEGKSYLLEDGIDAADETAAARSLSTILSKHGLRHRLEIYDVNDKIVLYLHHNWPGVRIC
jgi:hypothetical protein